MSESFSSSPRVARTEAQMPTAPRVWRAAPVMQSQRPLPPGAPRCPSRSAPTLSTQLSAASAQHARAPVAQGSSFSRTSTPQSLRPEPTLPAAVASTELARVSAAAAIGDAEEVLDVSDYRRAASRRMMLSHLQDALEAMPDLASFNWGALDTRALHTAVSGVTRMRNALSQGGHSQATQRSISNQMAVLHAAVASANRPRTSGKGLSASELDALPVQMCDASHLDEGKLAPTCVICHEEIALGAKLRQLPGCTHLYHSKCIEHWLLIKATCPLCNMKVEVQSVPFCKLVPSASKEDDDLPGPSEPRRRHSR